MLRSESIAKLAEALASAQGEFPPIPRDRTVRVRSQRTNTEYTFSYAPLDTILDKVRPPLAKHGLALVQGVELAQLETGKLPREFLRTTLLHASGEWLAHDQPLFSGSADNASQAYASGMTYARRYGVTALLCLAADDDDDANGTTEGEERPRHVQRGRQPPHGRQQREPRERDQRPAAVSADQVVAGEEGGEPGIHGLSAGMEKVLMAKASGVGMDKDALVRTFGRITPANINQVLGQLKPTEGA